MLRRTKGALAITAALLAVAVTAVVVAASASDNPRVTPLMVRDFTNGVFKLTVSLVVATWLVWYWLGRRAGDRR